MLSRNARMRNAEDVQVRVTSRSRTEPTSGVNYEKSFMIASWKKIPLTLIYCRIDSEQTPAHEYFPHWYTTDCRSTKTKVSVEYELHLQGKSFGFWTILLISVRASSGEFMCWNWCNQKQTCHQNTRNLHHDIITANHLVLTICKLQRNGPNWTLRYAPKKCSWNNDFSALDFENKSFVSYRAWFKPIKNFYFW